MTMAMAVAGEGEDLEDRSSTSNPLSTAVREEGAAGPESLNSILRRIIQENRENPMQALDETFGALELNLVPVFSVPSVDADVASNGGVSADGAE